MEIIVTRMVFTSNHSAKIIATENTEITEDFFSVSSVLSVCRQEVISQIA